MEVHILLMDYGDLITLKSWILHAKELNLNPGPFGPLNTHLEELVTHSR